MGWPTDRQMSGHGRQTGGKTDRQTDDSQAQKWAGKYENGQDR